MSEKTVCEICGKPPSPYPNWMIRQGYSYHVGCVTKDYDRIKEINSNLLKTLKIVRELAGPEMFLLVDAAIEKSK